MYLGLAVALATWYNEGKENHNTILLYALILKIVAQKYERRVCLRTVSKKVTTNVLANDCKIYSLVGNK